MKNNRKGTRLFSVGRDTRGDQHRVGAPPLPGQTGTPRERQQEVQEQTLFLNHTQEWILGRQPKYESWNYKDNLGDWFYDFEVGEDFLGVTPIK